jgi:hypothetical protein
MAKGMHNSRKDITSFSPPHHLEKEVDISCIMHYLLLLSLEISENQLFLEEINLLREDIWYNSKKVFSYYLRDHLLAKRRQSSLPYFSLLQLSLHGNSKERLTSSHCKYPK